VRIRSECGRVGWTAQPGPVLRLIFEGGGGSSNKETLDKSRGSQRRQVPAFLARSRLPLCVRFFLPSFPAVTIRTEIERIHQYKPAWLSQVGASPLSMRAVARERGRSPQRVIDAPQFGGPWRRSARIPRAQSADGNSAVHEMIMLSKLGLAGQGTRPRPHH
jgi:hypothetical protein